jgi:hypothetical protein
MMSASSRRPGTALGGEPLAGSEREPIAVFGLAAVVEGWIPKSEGRISDGLNNVDRVRVSTEMPDGSVGDWLEFQLDEVVAVAPAPRPASSARVSRRHHPVEVEAGPYRVKGIVHLPVGADPRRYVASTGRRWLPLTECTVSDADGDWAVDVVILNLDHAIRREAPQAPPKFG